MGNFFAELKRRKVFSAAATYCIVGWIIIEVASVIVPTLLLPDWTLRLVTILIIMGFPFAVALSWIFDFTSKGIERTESIEHTVGVNTSGDNLPTLQIPTAANVPTPAQTAQPPAGSEAKASVAVLPFEIYSSDPEHIVFAQGLTSEIHSLLARHESIQVVSRRATANISDPEQLIEKFNIQYLLAGNVTFDNDRVRIIAELDDAQQNIQIWSERFERAPEDRLSVFTEIAESVVAAFGVERLRTELSHARSGGGENPDAWTLVQKARAHLLEPETTAYIDARNWLNEAIVLEPNYSAAHATLAYAIAEQILNGASDTVKQDCGVAQSAIEQAVRLAPQDPFVLKMAGMAWSVIGQPSRALEVLEHAVAIAPFDFGAWGYMGWPLTARGLEEDIELLLNTLNRILSESANHPGAPMWFFHKSVAHSCLGETNEALSAAKYAAENAPKQSWIWLNLANIEATVGNYPAAENALHQATTVNAQMSVEHYFQQLARMNEGEGFVAQRSAGLKNMLAQLNTQQHQ